MSETATNELFDALSDPEQPFTPQIEEGAVGVAGCLRNVLKSSSGGSEAAGSTVSDSRVSKVLQRRLNLLPTQQKLDSV